LFVFFQSLIGFLGATVGMKTAVEEGAGKKLIKFGARGSMGDDFL